MRVTKKPGAAKAFKQAEKALDKAAVRVGWFAAAVYDKGQPVAGIAYVHEFGSPAQGIPPRLGLRNTAEEKREEWKKTAAQISKAALQGKADPSKVMESIAAVAEGAVRASITKIVSPPLKQSTIDARKRRLADKGRSVKGAKGGAGIAGISKPLVDTGVLLNSLSSEVVKK